MEWREEGEEGEKVKAGRCERISRRQWAGGNDKETLDTSRDVKVIWTAFWGNDQWHTNK